MVLEPERRRRRLQAHTHTRMTINSQGNGARGVLGRTPA
jgi:hypothetical protein